MEKKGWKILSIILALLFMFVLFLFVLFYFAGNYQIEKNFNRCMGLYNQMVSNVIQNCREYFCTYEFNCPEDMSLVIEKCSNILGDIRIMVP